MNDNSLTCDLASWRGPGGRLASMRCERDGLWLRLSGPHRLPGYGHDRWVSMRDTPRVRAHFRLLALDWCAHGVSPTGDMVTETGPKRGAMSYQRAMDLALASSVLGGPEWTLFSRMGAELLAVRERRGQGWPKGGR